MDSFGNFIWDSWSDKDSEEELVVERRQYNMYERIDYFNKWDDIDFFCRFRLQKSTVANLLVLIRDKLENKSQRKRNITPMAKLLIALRFYALGTMLISVRDFSGVSKAAISNVLVQGKYLDKLNLLPSTKI